MGDMIPATIRQETRASRTWNQLLLVIKANVKQVLHYCIVFDRYFFLTLIVLKINFCLLTGNFGWFLIFFVSKES